MVKTNTKSRRRVTIGHTQQHPIGIFDNMSNIFRKAKNKLSDWWDGKDLTNPLKRSNNYEKPNLRQQGRRHSSSVPLENFYDEVNLSEEPNHPPQQNRPKPKPMPIRVILFWKREYDDKFRKIKKYSEHHHKHLSECIKPKAIRIPLLTIPQKKPQATNPKPVTKAEHDLEFEA